MRSSPSPRLSFPDLWSGTVHYWRTDPALWEDVLKNVCAMGFSAVETYVPWAVHEEAPGRFEWGDRDPRRNLREFARLAAKVGLRLILRPGPHINAELTDFGFPARVLEDPECACRTPGGRVAVFPAAPRAFPMPSYASRKFLREVAAWFDAAAPLLRELLPPGGPLAALQVDNEMDWFFQLQAFDLDYHPEAVEAYREWVLRRYGSLDALNRLYGTRFRAAKEVDPPRRFSGEVPGDVPRALDWMRFKEEFRNGALRALAAMWRERGVLGVPFFHNDFGPMESPVDVGGLEAGESGLDAAGLDDYSRRENWREPLRKAVFLSGTSRYPFLPEFGAGIWTYPPCEWSLTAEDHRFTAPLSLMFGVQAVNFYMIQERDRWAGSPLSESNEVRRGLFQFYRELSAFRERAQLRGGKMEAPLLLVSDKCAERLARVLRRLDFSPLFGLPDGFCLEEGAPGWDGPPPRDFAAAREAAWDLVLTRHLPFRAADTGGLSRLFEHAVAWVLTLGWMDRQAQEALLSFAEGGGLLVTGPRAPCRDGVGGKGLFPELPENEPVPFGKGRLLLWTGAPEGLLGHLAAAGVRPLGDLPPSPVLAAAHRTPAGRVVFLANPTGGSLAAAFRLSPGARAEPLYGTHRSFSDGEAVEVPPWSVLAFLEVSP